jgi:hypothetical protein
VADTSTSTESAQVKDVDPVATRVAELRKRAVESPIEARDEVWDWFREAGERIPGDRDAALAELGTLFRAGKPATGIEGETEGMLVGWSVNSVFDRVIGSVTNSWLPWAGKRFKAGQGKGDNILVRSARWPAKLLWPLYATKSHGERLTAFDFVTRVENGVLDPDVAVLVIDYASVPDNPRLVIKQIRDELVEIVPGANLGKMIFEGPGERHTLAAYFALRSEIS